MRLRVIPGADTNSVTGTTGHRRAGLRDRPPRHASASGPGAVVPVWVDVVKGCTRRTHGTAGDDDSQRRNDHCSRYRPYPHPTPVNRRAVDVTQRDDT